jgi:AraC family transcriptional regulator
MYDIEVTERPARRVIGIGHRGPYDRIGGAFEALAAAAEAQGLWPEATEFLGVYFDDPEKTPAEDLRALAGIAVREDLALPDGFEQVRLAAGRHAVLRLIGPYAGLPAAWTWLYATWLPQSGLAPRDAPACEVYRNTPGQVPETELVTEICIPVA